MYEDTKRSIDWKGLFLKVVIAFLIVLIAIKGYSTLKGNNKPTEKTTTETTAESKSSSTFTANIEKLRNAGEKYFTNNKDKLPTSEGSTVMVTLNELVKSGEIEALADEDGKTCDGESSYVTAMLEGKKTKIKANLVCGSASSYSLVYMGENDNDYEETTTSSKTNNSYSTTKTTNTSNTKNTCTTNTCGSSTVKVTTDTKVSQNVTINNGKTNSSSNNSNNNNNNNNNNVTRKVTVSFDSNGGNRNYSSQKINVNERAYNPGSTSKNGYTFIGWYLNGYKYDFSTPVTKNITLVAKFSRNDSNYDDDYDDYDDYYDRTLKTSTYTSYVYTMGWDTRGTDYISIDHTLRLPEYLEDRDIEKVKISDITFYKSLNTSALAKTYKNNHRDTFFYERNGWESNIYTTNSLSTIKSNAVDFYYSSRYKDIDDALDDGFDVNWTADDVYEQCRTTFSVNGESNKCNYGIVYKVKWTYQYYN